MERFDIAENDVRHLGVLTEVRPDMILQHLLVVVRRAEALARQVLGLEPVAQVVHRGRRALGLNIGQRVAALVDQPLEPARFHASAVVAQFGKRRWYSGARGRCCGPRS